MELENEISQAGYLLELYFKLGLRELAVQQKNKMYALIAMRGAK